MFNDIIEDEIQKLKEMVENNELLNDKSNNFISDDDWEDEFSHNDIGEMQEMFMEKAKEYLLEKCKGKYIIYSDWCVHICSVEFFDKHLKDSSNRFIIC